MDKAKIVHFSGTSIVYDMEMQLTWTSMSAKVQDHLMTLAKVTLVENILSLVF